MQNMKDIERFNRDASLNDIVVNYVYCKRNEWMLTFSYNYIKNNACYTKVHSVKDQSIIQRSIVVLLLLCVCCLMPSLTVFQPYRGITF